MPRHQSLLAALIASTLALIATGALSSPHAVDVSPEDIELPGEVQEVTGQRVYSPFVGRDYPDQVLFGDMHFHTDASFDAGLIGTKLDVDAAYSFARGEKVISNTGQPVQLVRPLDFLFITDHAEFLGLPLLSPEDEFANFETWDLSNIAGNAAKEDWMLKYEYGSSALKVGLELAAKLGVNPYQFGFTGTTDTHTALDDLRCRVLQHRPSR